MVLHVGFVVHWLCLFQTEVPPNAGGQNHSKYKQLRNKCLQLCLGEKKKKNIMSAYCLRNQAIWSKYPNPREIIHSMRLKILYCFHCGVGESSPQAFSLWETNFVSIFHLLKQKNHIDISACFSSFFLHLSAFHPILSVVIIAAWMLILKYCWSKELHFWYRESIFVTCTTFWASVQFCI